jgi:hypothetical protein
MYTVGVVPSSPARQDDAMLKAESKAKMTLREHMT